MISSKPSRPGKKEPQNWWRRYSPSVRPWYPMSSWALTISLMALSSMASSSLSWAISKAGLPSRATRLSERSFGRRSEPICSARKGGRWWFLLADIINEAQVSHS